MLMFDSVAWLDRGRRMKIVRMAAAGQRPAAALGGEARRRTPKQHSRARNKAGKAPK
jgi:hypothetical protein